MRIVAAAVAAFLIWAAPACAEEWSVDLSWQTRADLARIAAHFQHLDVDRKRQTVRLIAEDAQLAMLDQLGVAYQVDMAETANMRVFYAEAFAPNRSIPGYACYRTVEETYATMDQLASNHPTLAQVIEIGPSWERTRDGSQGYTMRVMRIGNMATDATIPDKPDMVVFSSIHAREYAPAELNTRFAEWLLENYGTDPEATWLVDHQNFHLILQANPDGRKKAESGMSWRKNTNTVAANCGNSSGIDLNRNFPFHWGIVPGDGGSSSSICEVTYRGPAAQSEPETDNLVRYVAGVCDSDGECAGGILPDLRDGPMRPPTAAGDGGAAASVDYPGMFLDIHSYSSLVIWPWGDRSDDAPNGAALRTLGQRMAWFNQYSPDQADTLYPTDGTTDDTFYGALGAPSYAFELDQAFFQPCTSFLQDTLPKNLLALRYAARSLHAPYLLPGGPDVTRIEAGPDLIAAGTPVSLSARLDDSRFNQVNFSEPVQGIESASAYLDGLPWEGALPVATLQASDGTFDSPVEDASAVIATTGLSNGKHLLFVQGTDASAQAGSPNAVFIDVADAADIGTLAGNITALDTGTPLATSLRVTNPSTGETRTAASSLGDGSYLRTMLGGTVDIQVDAPQGYLGENFSGVPLIAGAVTTRNITLLHSCTVLFDDVEAGNSGWTAQSPWVRSNTVTGNSGFVWVTPQYQNNLDRSLSRSLDTTGYSDSVLQFDDRCDTEAGYDFGRVEISVNAGSNWTTLYQCSGRTAWQNNRVSLPASADDLADLRLRFRLTSDQSLNGSGWAIDNVLIESGGAQCRADQLDRIFADGFD